MPHDVRCFSSNANDQIAVEVNIRRRRLINNASGGSQFKTGCPGHQPKKINISISASNQESCLKIEFMDYRKNTDNQRPSDFSFTVKTSQFRGEVTCPRSHRKLATDEKLEVIHHQCSSANALLFRRRKLTIAFQTLHTC